MGLLGDKNDRNGKGPGVKFSLEFNGTPLYELHSAEYSKEIVIGRSAEADWHLEEVDDSLSARHAMLSRRRKNFYLTDLKSKNGIYYRNKKIQEMQLKPGDRVSLGACTLVVEEEAHATMRVQRFNRLVYHDDRGQKRVVDIDKPQMLIGTAKDCDIVLENQLVSSHHAKIALHSDGSCWISDLQSRNGTMVNGAELEIDGERLLQDNDTISISYIDMIFQDAAAEHHESHLWSYVSTIAVTLLICAGAYTAYMSITPSAEKLLASADLRMSEGDLDEAERLLTRVLPAKGGDNYRSEVAKKQAQIAKWRGVIAQWDKIKAKTDLTQVLRELAALVEHADSGTWNWRCGEVRGEVERGKAKALYQALALGGKAEALLKDAYAELPQLQRCRFELEQAMQELQRKNLGDVADRTLALTRERLEKLDKIQEDEKVLQQTLELLSNSGAPGRQNYRDILRELDRIILESSGLVKSRANRYRPAVQCLKENGEALVAMNTKVRDLDFSRLEGLRFVDNGCDFNVDKNIANQMETLKAEIDSFRNHALTVRNDYEQLAGQGVALGELPVAFQKFAFAENFVGEAGAATLREDAPLAGILAFDCLDEPPPNPNKPRSLSELHSEYDRCLGIEFFHEYLTFFSNRSTNYHSRESTPFEPYLVQYRKILNDAGIFVAAAEQDRRGWFDGGRLLEFTNQCKTLLADRDRMVAQLLAMEYSASSREFLLTRGVACYLMGEHDPRYADLAKKLHEGMKLNSAAVQAHNKQIVEASPARQIQLRPEIYAIALPGNRILSSYWKSNPLMTRVTVRDAAQQQQ